MRKKRTVKNIMYELIGRATVVLAAWGISICSFYHLIIFLLNNCCTTLR